MKHNILSFNQLAEWSEIDEPKLDSEIVNDYFDCLIDCADDHSSCKKICKEILT